MSTTTTMVPRLKVKYQEEIRASLQDSLGKDNIMQVPKLEKIVVNMGVGEAVSRGALLEGAISDLETITGQHPQITPLPVTGCGPRSRAAARCRSVRRGGDSSPFRARWPFRTFGHRGNRLIERRPIPQ